LLLEDLDQALHFGELEVLDVLDDFALGDRHVSVLRTDWVGISGGRRPPAGGGDRSATRRRRPRRAWTRSS
ncbi:MAG: hypothetical protein ACK559_34630, partial [bacterium]